jgi:predicted Zn-dependent peptidase
MRDKTMSDKRSGRALAIIFLLSIAMANSAANAALDLRNASVERLSNGLTVILLEDRNFPVASVQMLYRVGARDEITGKTGLAHFLEHMAFRSSENFPDTGLVSSIYSRGGEWHGYTWTDQTTYFSTVPKEQLDLLLRIEADRMMRLTLSADDLDAERGAVLAEMHMYENYPTSMLIDAVIFASFVAHPYRNNTIGWESDIENLQHRDVVDFYQRHYHTANAVLVVVGDIDSEQVSTRIAELFGEFPKKPPTAMPHTIEPLQNGERRVWLRGDTNFRQFMIAYRAPSANSPDFAAFLVLQSLLGASSGVNFNQNDWGTSIADGAVLDGAADSLTTWYPPSAQDYVFIIGGTAAAGASEADIETGIDKRIATVRRRAPDKNQLAAAIDDVLEQLVYDVETTEDAAHQLAFFEGLGALDTLFALPELVAAVTADDVQRVAAQYLLPRRRSIAWHGPKQRMPAAGFAVAADVKAPLVTPTAAHPVDTTPLPPPVARTLSGGIPVIMQQTDLAASAYLTVVLPSGRVGGATANDPVRGYSSISFRMRPGAAARTVANARALMLDAKDESGRSVTPAVDPETRLEQVFGEIMTGDELPAATKLAPALIVISGDLDVDETIAVLEKNFGKIAAPDKRAARSVGFAAEEITVNLGISVAQAQLGYIVPAAEPLDVAADAQQLLLYIVSHGYEGRLGKAAISERGLAYYIDSQYRSGGSDAWLTLSIGVDSGKIKALQELLDGELKRLIDEPPTPLEVEEAKSHFAGRARSAAQSNEELATALARHWLWYENTQTIESLERRLGRVSHQDVLDAIPAFINGTTIIVRE